MALPPSGPVGPVVPAGSPVVPPPSVPVALPLAGAGLVAAVEPLGVVLVGPVGPVVRPAPPDVSELLAGAGGAAALGPVVPVVPALALIAGDESTVGSLCV